MTQLKLASEVMIFSPMGEKVFWTTRLFKTLEEKKTFEQELDKVSDLADIHIKDVRVGA